METTRDTNDHDPRRAAIYLRVSSREQADGYSIPAQREACQRRIADEGWELAEEFCDSGESARSANRPEFQRMLQELAEDPSITVLVVHKLDRLARNLEDHVGIKARLRKLGVQLVSISETLEESASGRLVEGIMASIAEFYSANLAQEVKKGMTQKARSGGWPGPAPVGYRNVRLATTATRRGEAVILPDEEQAPLVRQAFERYATGEWSITELHQKMTKRGLKGRSSRGSSITRSKFAAMLQNPVYIGKVVWGGEEYEGTHEPLVSVDLFRRVQMVFRVHDRAGERRRRASHYLKGTVFCGVCGSRLSTMNAKGSYLYFYCLGAHSKRTQCSEPYTKAETLETQVANLYQRLSLPEGLTARLREELSSEIKARHADRIRAQELLHRRLRRLETELGKALDAHYAGAITQEQLKTEQKRISAEQARAERTLRETADVLADAEQVVETALELAHDLNRAYTQATPQVRRQYNLSLLGKIYVRDGMLVEAPQDQEPTSSKSRRNPTAHGPSR